MIHFTRSKGSKLHFEYFGIFLSRFYPHKRVPTYRNRHTRSIQIPGIVRYIYIGRKKDRPDREKRSVNANKEPRESFRAHKTIGGTRIFFSRGERAESLTNPEDYPNIESIMRFAIRRSLSSRKTCREKRVRKKLLFVGIAGSGSLGVMMTLRFCRKNK